MYAYYCGSYVVLKGTEYDDKPHKHFMKHIVIGLKEEAHCMIEGKEIYSKCILIQANMDHQIYKSNKEILLYLIPDCSDIGREMELRFFQNGSNYILQDSVISSLGENLERDFIFSRENSDYFLIFQKLLMELSIDINKKHIMDVRVIKSMKYIAENAKNEISMREIASAVFISPSRLSHLFKCETGVTIKNYVLLQRILIALRLIFEGKNITQACMQSGFSSPSHFADTIHKWFGLSAKRSMDYMKEKIISI